jgi:hypothetical protein
MPFPTRHKSRKINPTTTNTKWIKSDLFLIIALVGSFFGISLGTFTCNFTLTLLSLFSFSLSLSIMLVMEGSCKGTTVFISIVLAFMLSPVLYHITLGPNPVLVWDAKDMENVALKIIETGFVPYNFAGKPMFREEYVLFPTSFILLAILSESTSLNTHILMFFPIITLAYSLVIIVIAYKLSSSSSGFALAFLTMNFITIMMLSRFTYSHISRALILLFLYVILTKHRSLTTFTLLVLLAIVIPLSHSSESISLLVALLLLTIGYGIIPNDEGEKRFQLLRIISLIYGVVFLTHISFQAKLFTKSFIEMLKKTLTYFISTGLEASLTRFTPYDFSSLELSLILMGIISFTIIALIYFSTGLSLLTKKWSENRDLFPYIFSIIGLILVNIVIYFRTPFKSDIIWRFTYVFIVLLAMFVKGVEHNLGRLYTSTHALTRLLKNKIIVVLLLTLFINSMLIYNRYQHIGSEINIYVGTIHRRMDLSEIINKIDLNSSKNIIFMDSPQLPYYALRDYVVTRIPIEVYQIYIYDPEIPVYNYTLMNGLYQPRFILLSQTTQNITLKENTILFGSLNDVRHDDCLMRYIALIYNDGKLFIGAR